MYAWADPNTFSGVQGATLLNGFQLAEVTDQEVPEPAALALFGAGVVAFGLARRRRT